MPYSNTDPEKMILRDFLALDRTILAIERTMLAYMRTAMMLLISAITFIKLFQQNQFLIILGYILIPCSIGIGAFGFLHNYKMKKKVDSVMH